MLLTWRVAPKCATPGYRLGLYASMGHSGACSKVWVMARVRPNAEFDPIF